MIEVKSCPFCEKEDRLELQEQGFNDVYIDLIDANLNKIVRYWYTCQSCGFIYRSPKLSKKEQVILYDRYRDVSFRKETPDEYFERIAGYDNSKSENYKKVHYLIKKINLLDRGGQITVLDVGCGGGVLLHKVKEMVPKSITFGIEPNELYADLARRKSGAEEIKADYFIPGLFKSQSQFDIIFSCDVLEHVDSPNLFLNDIFDSLKENGVLFLEVPSPTNFDALEASHDIFNMAHHVFFTESVLYLYLKEAGFSDISIVDNEYENNAWKLRVIAKKIVF
jgi:2-polyprenyl-3-methyl-5-hydroxy-6-metoxy-1,4-benzoquinol methylase/glutaredoxin